MAPATSQTMTSTRVQATGELVDAHQQLQRQISRVLQLMLPRLPAAMCVMAPKHMSTAAEGLAKLVQTKWWVLFDHR